MNEAALFQRLSEIYPLSNEAFQRLQIYVARLKEWQAKTNLVAPSTLENIWERHVADSLQCLALKPDAKSWLDIGSGGGFPGLVISAVLADKGGTIILIESLQKKTAFLRQVNRQIGGVAEVVTSRIEAADIGDKEIEVVTARALAPIGKLFDLTQRWLNGDTIGLFHKGRDFQSELADCDGLWSYDLVKHESKISPDSVILEITNLDYKKRQKF